MSETKEPKLEGKWEVLFIIYNIIFAVLFSSLLIYFVARAPYLPSPADESSSTIQLTSTSQPSSTTQPLSTDQLTSIPQPTSTSEANLSIPSASNDTAPPLQPLDVLLPTLLTMLCAGGAGGTLCNLRGIFKYYRDEDEFPLELVVPFIIRPFMGSIAGVLIFFLGNFFNSALSDVSPQSWATLPGRLPYIGLALLAGFGSQEFMQRLKEIAKTTFSEDKEQEKPTNTRKTELAK
jgi:hypothetical protein